MAVRERYKYTALQTPDASYHPAHNAAEARRRHQKLLKMGLAAIGFIIILYLVFTYGLSDRTEACELKANCTGISSHIWGQYSPWFHVPSYLDTSLGKGCEVTFAAVLARHGSRDPTRGKSKLYHALIDRVQESVTNYGTGLEFIKDYTYTLGSDNLTFYGEREMAELGATFYSRYSKLAEQAEPFIRASGEGRVIESSKHFAQGFYESQEKNAAERYDDIAILPEGQGFNNTLDHGGCPKFEDGPYSTLGHDKQTAWRDVWVGGMKNRLNQKLSGANFTSDEAVYMMDLCPFNTVASANGTRSDFCNIFSEDEWKSYDYFQSLGKWYGHGLGNPMGSTQGVGYVNELIARLTGEPVVDDTTTNHTITSSPKTFPLDRKLYADFSHDNAMVSIYAALGLYNETGDLPTKYKLPPQKLNGFSAAWTVPFAGRMYVEKVRCGESEDHDQDDMMVRILVNDRVVPLPQCNSDHRGLCRLDDFVASLSFARNGGLWGECFQ